MIDLAALQADFPGLDQRVNEKPLIYLDNAASSQICRPSFEAIQRAYLQDRANVHRGVHTLSQRATTSYEAARDSARRFLNAASTDEIVFTRGTTEAINLVAHSLGATFEAGDEVVISAMEHHSNIVPWQMLAERAGIVLRVVPFDGRGVLDLSAYAELLGPRTRLVSLVHVSNALGTVNPARQLVQMAHEHGAHVLLDGAQATPHGPVDVQALDVDFYCFSGHKVYGPTGIGVLYGKRALLERMPPYQGGGDMIDEVRLTGSTWAAPPSRFEAGTPHIAGAIGLGAALEWSLAQDWEALRRHEDLVLERATALLSEIDGLRLVGTAPDKRSVCSFVIEGAHAQDVGALLDMYGVAVRTGHHCAQPAMACFGVAATARASFAPYNSVDDAVALARALHRVVKMLG